MSQGIYGLSGVRVHGEREIKLRNVITELMADRVQHVLTKMNKAWVFERIEGPVLIPSENINPNYTEDDFFCTQHAVNLDDFFCLRPETTASSYEYARTNYKDKYPVCIWQLGKSFRRELNDGATASKLRFNEFYQLEFQCIYKADTKADYRAALIPAVEFQLQMFGMQTKVVESDRLPDYSEVTTDIEAFDKVGNKMFEVASCSIRTDFAPDVKVCEIAIGIDRVTEILNKLDIIK